MRRHLGFPSLREGQAETIARVLKGEDVLAILPTGGGKSMCYQLPAMLSKGVTLVVSPLVALMKDQLDSLPPAMRAASTSITGELSSREIRQVVDEVARGRYRLVYVAPERLRQTALLQALRAAGVARLVVDEAHCVSVWGHDFRPDYLGIANVRKQLGDPPLLAVTATAPPRVLSDIQARLGPLELVRASVHRPNLRLEAILAKDADEKLAHLLKLCQESEGPGIVYATSRVKCEQLAAALAQNGVNALAYHAGLPDRSERQEAFMRNEAHVLVATVAFGMGVDKGDIRFVFHHDPASSLENYYQEAGRAGRDGAPARCVVLATPADGGSLKTRAKSDLPGRELVGRAWALVLAGAGDDGYAIVDPEQLDALAPDDEVKPRVALSILVESGALERLPDVPRFLVVGGRESSVFDVAARLGVQPEGVETALLAKGERYQATGRAMLFRVKGHPERAESVLETYHARAEARAKEIMDYIRASDCRHSMLRRFFGETPPPRCGNCDFCLGIRHEPAGASQEDDEAAGRNVLLALSSVRGIGETNLVYMLRGDPLAPPWTDGKPGAGTLGFRSPSKIKTLVKRLESRGFIARETLPHGGVTLKLSLEGERALRGNGATLLPPEARAAPSSSSGAPPPDLAPEDAPLLEALRAWRRSRAAADGVPGYVVAHDATLALVAAAKPRTPDGLRGIKGFGPARVAKYGEEILDIVSRFVA